MKHIMYLVTALMLTAATLGGYVYMLSTMRESVDVLTLAQGDIVTAGEREKQNRTASVFLADTETERSELETFIAKDADFVSVIETIEASASREDVSTTIGSVTVTTNKNIKFHDVVVVTVSAEGTFPDVTAFVASLESLPVASRVTSVSFEQSTGNLWFGRVTLELIKEKTTL